MSHYWTSDELMAQRESQITDWIADLIEYPVGLVEDACATWRRTQRTRPTPADIRRLCNEQAALPAPEHEEDWDEVEIMRRADAWARDRGYAGIEDFQATGQTAVMWLPNGRRRRFYAQEGRADYDMRSGSPPTSFQFTDREIRTRLQWARDHGYETWNDFLDAVQEGKESVLPYLDWYKAEYAPPATAGTFKSLGQALANATGKTP